MQNWLKEKKFWCLLDSNHIKEFVFIIERNVKDFMDNRPIGIFDSGVGGLTVLTEIKKILPNEKLIYLGDTLNFPYGPKTSTEIINYSIENAEFLVSKNAKMIIIACGTATSYALKTLNSKFNIPVIGIIEPTISYIKTLNLKEIRNYCNRRYYQK